MRFLLLPCNNTLSHVAKSLAVRRALEARGHEVFLAVAAARTAFLERLGETRYEVLPDIQEADGAPLPGFCWFRPERVEACVRAETALLRALRPDRVLGVFRFTGGLSATLAGIPYDSLICGSMTPAFDGVLGFAPGEPGAERQAGALRFFRHACAQRLAPALAALGLAPVDDILELLVGQQTFLWDTPAFQPLPPAPGYRHVGPVDWPAWPQPAICGAGLGRLRGPIAYVALGTGGAPMPLLRRLIEVLWSMGHSVALALGGQTAAGLPNDPSRLAAFEFLPSALALPRASLVVCHGGQGLVFDALRQRVPVFVLPMQSEQAQNGVCLERLGCGRRVLRGIVFDGAAMVEREFLARPTETVAEEMSALMAEPGLPERLAHAGADLARYHGAESLAAGMEHP